MVLTQAKAYIAGALLLAAFAGGWLVNGWRLSGSLNKVKGELSTCAQERDTLRLKSAQDDKTIAAFRADVERQNAAVDKLKAEGDALQAKVNRATADILAQQAEYERRLAEGQKPLPANCDAAVREAARRMGARP